MLNFGSGQTFSLRIRSISTVAAQLTVRGLTRDGIFTLRHTTTSDLVQQEQIFRMPDIPIFISVVDELGSFVQGECYVTLSLLANNDELYQFSSGLVYVDKGLAWPDNGAMDTMPGHGRFITITGANPAAGAEISVTVPANTIWRLRSLNFTLVTDANAANRRVHVVLTTGGGQIINCFGTIDQTASLTRLYSVASYGSVPDETDDNDIIIPIPNDVWLTTSSTMTTETTNILAGDNFGAPLIEVERFINAGE